MSTLPKPRRKRVGMISLGCPKNRVDSEIMLGELGERGYQVVADAGEAGTVIVNTCGFIDQAKEESIDAILEAAGRKLPGGRLLVAGCMVNRYGQELRAEIPEIDGFISLDQLRDVGSLVRIGEGASVAPLSAAPLSDAPRSAAVGSHPAAPAPAPPGPSQAVYDHTAPRLLTTHGYAYLKVAEGCDNPCTFCAIPSWRGRFRSRGLDSLLAEARRLEAQGIRELCLVAQDTTRYGQDIGYGKHGLARLVETLLAGTSIPWIRFLYAYPTTLDVELLRLMGAERRFVPYIDIPLQHSHPEVLKAMRRGGSQERYLRLLERARELVPGIFLRTTFIVGFPGETAEHFDHLLDFVRRARFDHLGAFVYSPEPGTAGAELDSRVPPATARRRSRRLLEAQEPIALESRRALVGRTLEVLVEGACDETEHLLQGRHQGMAPEIDGRLLINDGMAPPATLAEVEITEAYADDLIGRVVGPAAAPGVVAALAVADVAAG